MRPRDTGEGGDKRRLRPAAQLHKLGHRFELLHHPDHVELTPALDDLAVLDPVEAVVVGVEDLAHLVGQHGIPTEDGELSPTIARGKPLRRSWSSCH